jgi:hypothetical protein
MTALSLAIPQEVRRSLRRKVIPVERSVGWIIAIGDAAGNFEGWHALLLTSAGWFLELYQRFGDADMAVL